ncbi:MULTISPECIES: hypothetical protein [Halomonas]|uniref:hypothetical protein n=1 Tax=Halomonas TaxID=2745 RepID=UPI001A8F89FB|nr:MULTISPECIES: hypothetical protein [Halomonas]MBN8413730.1 hypothetical protein [Halomonas litopenaei]MBY5967822.1 hypothetical protein [Halomonas denitrificans]MBY5983324.1 hypothetical protein [Halomonas sp. DP5Y7-2]
MSRYLLNGIMCAVLRCMRKYFVFREVAVSPLFFIHIPKTAGTSFRLGMQQALGEQSIIYDYGSHSLTTHPLVREFIYEGREDAWQFYRGCLDIQAKVVAGHVEATKYIPVFGATQALTFLREPLQRAASEYWHFQRHDRYKGSFSEFIRLHSFVNRQKTILNGVDPEALGVIGLTERYSESLELINTRYDIDIPPKEANLSSRQLGARHEIEPKDERDFYQINAQEVELYQHCCKLFDMRMELYRRNLRYSHCKMTCCNTESVSGWAWWETDADDPVVIDVLVNGERAVTVPAMQPCDDVQNWLAPRSGCVGFKVAIKLSAGDEVQCRVADTGQCFPIEPYRIAAPH